MKQTIKKSLAIIFAALITSATAAMLTGCGEDNKESNSAATTVAATTVAKTTGSTGQSSNANQTQGDQNSQSAESSGSDNGSSQSDDGYIDQQTAIANVKQQAGSGATIISSTKGYAPDGVKAWVIVVQPVTNNDSTDTVTYYSGYQFCYPAEASGNNDSDSSDDSDGYIDEQTAISNVKQQAGSGATIVSAAKGYSPDGVKAWVIVVQPVTNNDSTDTVTYYSGYQFCYPED
ncbi:hypothetical protein [Ruminococcus sp.]|uniref:hypothetical protein n=1 Tax=Ruminococcus sp. TaxID=41978 RepID=UPI002E765BD8|nr:hypothetical protein [Ruminococcus sp.]MEE1262315.1 hypothetical protein [Ruminococcus sp.]